MFRNKLFLFIIIIVYACGIKEESPRFQRILTDSKLLNGNWYLYQKIIPEVNSRDSIFPIDSLTFQGKRIIIDVEKMLFSIELYPYNAVVSKYRMIIFQDSLKVKSGAFQNGEPLYKNAFTFMLSKNAEHLRIHNIDAKEIEVYHKR